MSFGIVSFALIEIVLGWRVEIAPFCNKILTRYATARIGGEKQGSGGGLFQLARSALRRHCQAPKTLICVFEDRLREWS